MVLQGSCDMENSQSLEPVIVIWRTRESVRYSISGVRESASLAGPVRTGVFSSRKFYPLPTYNRVTAVAKRRYQGGRFMCTTREQYMATSKGIFPDPVATILHALIHLRRIPWSTTMGMPD